MKKILLVPLLISLMGCQSLKHAYYDRVEIAKAPQVIADVNTAFTYDKFEGHGWLSTDYHMSWFESAQNGIAYKYRAFFAKEYSAKPEFIQLYFTLKSPSWYFIDSVYNENGIKYSFTSIERDTASAGNVYEYFAVTLTIQQLLELEKSNLSLKIVGGKDVEIFPVSKLVAQSFHEALESRDSL
jgi:hypothetical protein